MIRFLPASGWTILLYGLTIATAGLPVGPTTVPNATAYEISRSVWWFEVNHAVLHAATFAVLGGLLIYAHRKEPFSKRNEIVIVVLSITVAVGIGQELIQSAARSRIVFGNSLFDVACDLGGAAMCVAILMRKAKHKAG